MVAKVTTRQLQASGILIRNGLSSSGAAGLIGNFSWECGSPQLPTAFRVAHLDHGSQGLPQWRLSRLTNYMEFVAQKHSDLNQADYSPTSQLWPYFGRLDYQLLFVVHELRGDYPKLYEKLCQGGDVASLTADVCWQYERPNKAMAHLAERVAYAKAISAALVKSSLPTDLPTHLASMTHQSEQQTKAAAGVVMLPVLATGGGVLAVAHRHLDLPWYGWLFFATCLVALVAAIAAYFITRQQEVNIKAATTVVPDAKPAEPVKATRPITANTVTTATSVAAQSAARAKNEEDIALAAAMK